MESRVQGQREAENRVPEIYVPKGASIRTDPEKQEKSLARVRGAASVSPRTVCVWCPGLRAEGAPAPRAVRSSPTAEKHNGRGPRPPPWPCVQAPQQGPQQSLMRADHTCLPAPGSRWPLRVPKPTCWAPRGQLCDALWLITKFQRTQAPGPRKCPRKCMSFPGPQNVTSLGSRVSADGVN